METLLQSVIENIEKIIFGKRDAVLGILKGILAEGHILIEDIPGTGKTTLAKAIASSLDLSFQRIQFTPDLLPSDITGISIYNQKTMQFEFRKGPIFTNILLADEINRTSPKTQSALLESMEERQITENGTSWAMPRPFIVIATQNPVEYEGTFNLPEAQLDRFLLCVTIGHPDFDTEVEILKDKTERSSPLELSAVAQAEEIVELQKKRASVIISEHIYNYIAMITSKTRTHEYLSLGLSTRGALFLARTAQAAALLDGRDFVSPDDIKKNAVSVLAHRLFLSPLGRSRGASKTDIVLEILDSIRIPGM